MPRVNKLGVFKTYGEDQPDFVQSAMTETFNEELKEKIVNKVIFKVSIIVIIYKKPVSKPYRKLSFKDANSLHYSRIQIPCARHYNPRFVYF